MFIKGIAVGVFLVLVIGFSLWEWDKFAMEATSAILLIAFFLPVLVGFFVQAIIPILKEGGNDS